MAKTEKAPGFEQGMEQLEMIVNALEAGKLPLNESFAAYERGMKLARELDAQLSLSEAKIKILTADGERDIEEEA